jgi:HEAT repeat protein
MEELLKSKKTEDRIKGVQLLLRKGANADPNLLLKLLTDRSPYVAAIAAKALGSCADMPAMRLMIERFEAISSDGFKLDPGCHIRAGLASSFANLNCLHAEPVLLTGIRTVQIEPVGGVPFDTGAHLRGACALALGQIGARDALREISYLLFDHGTRACGAGDRNSVFVEPRKCAVQALQALGTQEALFPLALRLKYPEGETSEVLQECMAALVQLEDPFLEDTLELYFDSKMSAEHPELAAYAALMLARARVPNAERKLEMLICECYERPTLEALVAGLAAVRTAGAQAALKRLAEHERRLVREAVQSVLEE